MPVWRYLGARTAFGTIVHIAERIYNPEAGIVTLTLSKGAEYRLRT